MKKAYESPKVEWVTLQPSEPVAAPCWSQLGKARQYTGSRTGCQAGEILCRFWADICLWLPMSPHLEHYSDKAWLLRSGSGVLE